MSRRVLPDERGAITVIALFFIVFAIAMLYTVVGTAETVLFREHLQDAVDGAALSSAVMHARAMNLIVLINLVMAALLAVLVTIKLIESVAIIAAIIAAALAWVTYGATLSAIPPLHSVQQNMEKAYEQVKDPIYTALEALHDFSGFVVQAAPTAAFAVAEADLERSKPTVKNGVVLGTRENQDLPLVDGSFDELCGKAGSMPIVLGEMALKEAQIPALPQLMGALKGPMESLTSQFSDWFCGDSDGGGSSKAPANQQWVDGTYPQPNGENAERCKNRADLQGPSNSPKDATSESCDRLKKEEEENAPDPKTGNCPTNGDCSLNGAYDTRVTRARAECSPTLSPPPYEYWYQERAGHVDYVWTGAFWKREEPTFEAPLRRSGPKGDDGSEHGVPQAPCGPKGSGAAAVGYHLKVHPGDDVNEINPVCSTEEPPPVPKLLPSRGTVHHEDFTEITQILGCRRKVLQDMPIDAGEQAKGGSGNEKSPKVLDENVTLGDENFQIRGVVEGDRAAQQALGVVRLALWTEPDPADPLASLAHYTNFSTAQSEYFYDAPDARDAWMWNMRWRARLRRFRLPDGNLQKAEALCSAVLDQSVCQDVFALGKHDQTQFTH